MAEDVPPFDAEDVSYCGYVRGIMFDSCGPRTRRNPRFSSPSLIEKNELLSDCKRSERRPQHFVTEVQPAVDAEKWQSPVHTGARVDGEIQPASVYGPGRERWCFPLLSPEREKALARRPVPML